MFVVIVSYLIYYERPWLIVVYCNASFTWMLSKLLSIYYLSLQINIIYIIIILFLISCHQSSFLMHPRAQTHCNIYTTSSDMADVQLNYNTFAIALSYVTIVVVSIIYRCYILSLQLHRISIIIIVSDTNTIITSIIYLLLVVVVVVLHIT